MIKKIYYWIHRKFSNPQERGEYSAGVWQSRVRGESLKLCQCSKGRLLEVGCGEGLFLVDFALANEYAQVYGVDNRTDILEKAEAKIKNRKLKNIKLYQADGVSLPFQNSYFDTVVCINVIFNLESQYVVRKVLKEVARVCKKGGRVIFDFRNSRNPFLYLKYKFAPFYDATVKDLPLKTYSLKDISMLLDGLGLEIFKQIPLGFPIKSIAPLIILEIKKI